MASQAWCQKEKVKNKAWFVRLILTVFYRTIEIISDMVFWLIHKKKEKTILPAFDNLLLLESASSLARKIRTRKVYLVVPSRNSGCSVTFDVSLNAIF
jgi:fatty acid amide hydrolase 2